MPVCNDCGGTVIEYDTAAGNGFCIRCGTVVEENTIVSEITFSETNTGAATVTGSYVGQGATHARISGPYGNRGSSESREQTIANASRKIQNIANVLHLSEVVCLAATRLYTLAVEHKFTKGRKSLNVVAVCLYVACRQKESRNYMLIDFSDLLQVNVFELGHTYLQLVQTLNLRLPLVDPSHYISRFAALLEFGDETQKVAFDAIRLVKRFDRDWMTRGRRPAGICGAALLLAARMNNFRRSIEEIVQVVKIADTTLKKRLDEFKNTPSGNLTLADFRSVWLDEEMDPPAFIKNKEKEEAARQAERDALEGESEDMDPIIDKKSRKGAKRKRKRKRNEDVVDKTQESAAGPSSSSPFSTQVPVDPSLLNQGILAGTVNPEPLFEPEPPDDIDYNIDPALLPPLQYPPDPPPHSVSPNIVTTPPAACLVSAVEATVSTALAEEVSNFLENEQGAMLSNALDEAEERRRAQITVVDELLGLDEEELDRFILTEEEVKIKERVWVELNKEYLEALAAKGEQQTLGSTTTNRKRRKTAKPRDACTPHGSTAAESVQKLIKKNPKYSKRINYDALKNLFTDDEVSPAISIPELDNKDDEALYIMDQKSDGDGDGMGVVVIEEAGSVSMNPPSSQLDGRTDLDEMEDEDGSDKGDDPGPADWEDAYEQEL